MSAAECTLTSETTVAQHELAYEIAGAEPITVGSLTVHPFKFVYRVAYSRATWTVIGKRILKSGKETTTHSFSEWNIRRTAMPVWLSELVLLAEQRAHRNGWLKAS